MTAATEPKPLLKLLTNECRYPVGEDRGTHLFCGAKRADPAVSYCNKHLRVMYQPPKPRRDPVPALQNG